MMIFMAGPIIRCQADIERTEFDLDNDEKEKTNRTLSLSVTNQYTQVFSLFVDPLMTVPICGLSYSTDLI